MLKTSKWFAKDENGDWYCYYAIEMTMYSLSQIRKKKYNSLEGFKTMIMNGQFVVSYKVGLTTQGDENDNFKVYDYQILANVLQQLEELPEV